MILSGKISQEFKGSQSRDLSLLTKCCLQGATNSVRTGPVASSELFETKYRRRDVCKILFLLSTLYTYKMAADEQPFYDSSAIVNASTCQLNPI